MSVLMQSMEKKTIIDQVGLGNSGHMVTIVNSVIIRYKIEIDTFWRINLVH